MRALVSADPAPGASQVDAEEFAEAEKRHVEGTSRAESQYVRLVVLSFGAILLVAGIVVTVLSIDHGTSYLPGLTMCAISLVPLRLAIPRRQQSTIDRYADEIRRNVDDGAEAPRILVTGAEATVHITNSKNRDEGTVQASEALQKQEAILREIYTQGLAQANASFRVSIFFASIGATFLLVGIGLAIFFARTSGQQYASIVAGTAGVIVNLTSSVFFVQSNRARNNMVKQGALLREESQDDRRLSAARELAAAINEVGLRDTVRAKLALILLGSQAEVGYGAEELLRREDNLREDKRRQLQLNLDLLGELVRRGLLDSVDLNLEKLIDDVLRPNRADRTDDPPRPTTEP